MARTVTNRSHRCYFRSNSGSTPGCISSEKLPRAEKGYRLHGCFRCLFKTTTFGIIFDVEPGASPVYAARR